MCGTKTLNYGCPLYSPMDGLHAHISSFAQIFAPEYQHYPKFDLRWPVDFDGVYSHDKT